MQSNSDALLHSENIKHIPFRGKHICNYLRRRAIFIKSATSSLNDPSVSIVIRTKNDAAYLDNLIKDIQAQVFNGSVEIILVDTESTDGTIEIAKRYSLKVISISQHNFSYPKALNLGASKASNKYILTLVGHSSLSNIYMLRALTYWDQKKSFAGFYSLPLPNWNASKAEIWAWSLNILSKRLKEPRIISKAAMGIMGANCSIIKRDAWERFGGYDERYAAGGEELPLVKQILSSGLLIVEEPLCTVYHSHGIGPINGMKQFLHWYQVSKKPLPFNVEGVKKRRPDMRSKIS